MILFRPCWTFFRAVDQFIAGTKKTQHGAKENPTRVSQRMSGDRRKMYLC